MHVAKVALSGRIAPLGRIILVVRVVSHEDSSQVCAEAAHALLVSDNFVVNVAQLRQAPLRQLRLRVRCRKMFGSGQRRRSRGKLTAPRAHTRFLTGERGHLTSTSQ
eukprot:IDg7902t1